MTFPYDGFDPQVITSAAINFSGSGDHTLVTPPSGSRVLVYQLFFVTDSAATFQFKSGSNALTGPLPITANGAMTLDNNREPWFVTGVDEPFILNSGAAVVGGIIGYAFYKR